MPKIIRLTTKIKIKIKNKNTPNTKTTFSQIFSTKHHHSYTISQPTFKVQTFNWLTSQNYITTSMLHQPKATHTLKKNTHWPSSKQDLCKRRTLLPTPNDASHQQHHITTQLTNITNPDITKKTTIMPVPPSNCINQQH